METELIIAIVTSSAAAITSIVTALIARSNKKDASNYRTKREKLDRAKWKVLTATMEGVSLLLHHAHGEKLNGNVDEALDKVKEAEAELDNVMNDIIVDV